MLTFVAVVPYFVFMWVAVAVFCFRTPTLPHSPFPRWFGWFTAWVTLMFEAGPLAFLTRTGPFAWDGLLVFWAPFSLVVGWMSAMVYLLLRAIRHQDGETDAILPAPVAAGAQSRPPAPPSFPSCARR